MDRRRQRPAFLSAAARQYADDCNGLRELALRWWEQEPANPQAWFALGIAYYKSGQAGEAIHAFERTVAIDPRLRTAWYYLGAAYRSEGQAQGEARALEHLDAVSTRPPPVHCARAAHPTDAAPGRR